MPDSDSLSPLPNASKKEHPIPNHHPQHPVFAPSPAATYTTSPALTPYTDPSYPNACNYTFHSALPSPAFMPRNHQQPYISHSASASLSTSPNLIPQKSEKMSVDIDHETTAACLLMLNSDRRGTGAGIVDGMGGTGRVGTGTGMDKDRGRGRGMSVRDLLSS